MHVADIARPVFNLKAQDTQKKQGKKGRREGKASNSARRPIASSGNAKTQHTPAPQIVIDIARSDVGGHRRQANEKHPEKESGQKKEMTPVVRSTRTSLYRAV